MSLRFIGQVFTFSVFQSHENVNKTNHSVFNSLGVSMTENVLKILLAEEKIIMLNIRKEKSRQLAQWYIRSSSKEVMECEI